MEGWLDCELAYLVHFKLKRFTDNVVEKQKVCDHRISP